MRGRPLTFTPSPYVAMHANVAPTEALSLHGNAVEFVSIAEFYNVWVEYRKMQRQLIAGVGTCGAALVAAAAMARPSAADGLKAATPAREPFAVNVR